MSEVKTYELDFKKIKQKVSMKMVIKKFEVFEFDEEFKRKTPESELRGPCTLPGCNGNRTFTINTEKGENRSGVFKCHACRRSGDIFSYVQYRCDLKSVRESALHIVNTLFPDLVVDEEVAKGDVPLSSIEITPGIYALGHERFEVIGSGYPVPEGECTVSGEACHVMVIYRELFGDYRYLLAAMHDFENWMVDKKDPQLRLIKAQSNY